MAKMFQFDLDAIVTEAIGGVPYPGRLTPETIALCAIAERLEAIYELMERKERDGNRV